MYSNARTMNTSVRTFGVPGKGRIVSNPIDENALSLPAEIVPARPGAGAGLMELLSAFAASMDAWPGALFQLSEADLGKVVSTMLTVVGRAENVAALATSDALTRGTVTGSTATGAPGWVAQVARGVDPVVVHRVGGVGRDCADPKNRVVAQCLAEGSASVPAAAVALREVPRVVRQLPCADRDDMFLRYLSLSHFGPRALKELSTRIIGQFAPEQLMRDEETQQQCEAALVRPARWDGPVRSRPVRGPRSDGETRPVVPLGADTTDLPRRPRPQQRHG
ncbi:hypothetical protein [Allobranchiibius sp. GilTou73]|uniref:hypothetical protein n=1 Tax=Allobranchiibius sp. GilTou73 TaxID=2904523 RepID=UPI001F2D685C|nr:hypothetical protein [Allobranchiibius sp. GilTou73]UIJ35061.1 hypothetical protein LVQ62_01210 [Allobranchiibius sp. GilTou73]